MRSGFFFVPERKHFIRVIIYNIRYSWYKMLLLPTNRMRIRLCILAIASLTGIAAASAQTTGVTLSVTDGKTTISAGDSMIYVVTASQNTQATRDVTLKLVLPAGMDLISPDNGGQVNGQTVTWSNATLTQNTNRIFTVQARVLNSLANGTVLTATASADSAQATDTTTVQSGAAATKAYALTFTDNTSSVRASGSLQYVLTVKNNSVASQTDNVVVQGPVTIAVQSGTPLPTTVGTNSATWSNVTFAPGETKTFAFNALVDGGARTGTTIETRATVANASVADLTAVNNNQSSSSSSSRHSSTSSSRSSRSSASSRATVANALFRMTADTNEVTPGGTISYALFAQNVLLQNVRDAKVTLKFDPSLAAVLTSANGTVSQNGEVTWLLPTLAPGAIWQTNVTLRASGTVNTGDFITASATLTGNDVSGSAINERIVSVSTVVVGRLPDTGAAFDTLFLILSGLLAAFFGFSQRKVSAL